MAEKNLAGPRNANDPLAELARIIGQADKPSTSSPEAVARETPHRLDTSPKSDERERLPACGSYVPCFEDAFYERAWFSDPQYLAFRTQNLLERTAG